MAEAASLPESLGLADRVALVTGGSRGIGAAIARTLAARGASVAVNFASREDAARAVCEEIEAAGGKAIAVGFDVSDPGAVDRGVKDVVERLGALQVLVNNAGISIDALLMRASADDLARNTIPRWKLAPRRRAPKLTWRTTLSRSNSPRPTLTRYKAATS